MRKLYRETFDEVRTSERRKEEILHMREQNHTRRRNLPAVGLAAAVLAVILATSALAVAVSPGLRSWFAQQWGERTGGEISENQALLIDSLTQQVGQSATDNGVTVTVDSITVGSDNLWVLLEAEGLDFDERKVYTFDGTSVEIAPDPAKGEIGGASYSVGSIGVTESGAVRMLLDYSAIISSRNQLTDGGYTLELVFKDLSRVQSGASENEILCPGTWTFSIPLTVESVAQAITIDSAVVKGWVSEVADGGETVDSEALEGVTVEPSPADFMLRDIQVTATGLSFYTTYSDYEAAERVQMTALSHLEAAVILSDGTEVVSGSGGGSRTEDGGWYCTSQWPAPIDVEDVVALRIGETEIPVK